MDYDASRIANGIIHSAKTIPAYMKFSFLRIMLNKKHKHAMNVMK